MPAMGLVAGEGCLQLAVRCSGWGGGCGSTGPLCPRSYIPAEEGQRRRAACPIQAQGHAKPKLGHRMTPATFPWFRLLEPKAKGVCSSGFGCQAAWQGSEFPWRSSSVPLPLCLLPSEVPISGPA